MENAEVPSPELSNEEKQRAVKAAEETLDLSQQLLQSELILLYVEALLMDFSPVICVFTCFESQYCIS